MTKNAIRDTKRQLRNIIKKRLTTLSSESLHGQSLEVTKVVTNLPEFHSATSVGVYMNMPHLEVQTMNILRTCFEMKKEVFLPRCDVGPKEGRKKLHLSMIKVDKFSDVEALQPRGKYKLLEPTDGVDVMDTGTLDLIIVPGVAFTREMKRLGHGAGFYDEFLSVYFKKFARKPHLIGIGLKEQLVDKIPSEEHDWDLDCLVIGNESIRGPSFTAS